MFQMLAVFAESERAMIRERVNAGLARARQKGTKSGRAIGRPATARAKGEQIAKLKARGLSAQAIADKLGIGKASG
jgi:DNA invertase Pin-like site-specific DNA recombinase